MNKKYSARLLSQIVFTILLITVCAGSVLATDITVSAAQYPGFNPSGLPADVSGSNASVTNNSTTVTLTVANGFRPSWNGLKGFRIALGGVDYTVSSTTYNSSTQTGTFTLGNAYAASTGTVSWKVYTLVLLRVYANKDFTVSDGSYIVSGSTPGSGAFYQQYACSVINGTLYVPTVVLPSTTDAYVVAQRNAKYTMNLYRPDGNSLIQTFQCMGNVFIPASPTTTTWGDLCQTNTTSTTVVQNLNTLTTTEIESRLNNFYSSALGTTGRIQKKISSNSLGDSILSESAATVTANGNLTVTTNQSVGGTQSVSGAASFGSTVTLSADPATSLEASTKKFADFNGAEIRAYQYATLGAAVTAIGSSTKVLQIGEPLTCNSSVIIPSTLTLRFTGSGMITYALGCSITFAGAGVEAGMNRQIFSGFTANASSPPIKWSTTYPDQISFKWFGGPTSATGAENSNAWRLMFDAMAAPIGDGSSPSVVQQGALVYVPPSTSACYAFDDTAQITKPVNLRGGASAGWYRNTCLSFPKGKTGLYVNGVNTWLSPYSSGPVFAGFANLENITVIGGGYKHDAPTSAVDMSVDTTSGSLVITRNASDTTHTFGQDVARDVTVVVNRYVYAVDSKDSTTQITIKKPRFFVQATPGSSAVRMVSGYAPHTLSGATITETSDWNGQQIEIDSKMYAISSITHDATFNESIINLTTNYSGTTNTSGTDCINNETPCHRGTATVQSLNTMSGQNLWINNAHGIDSKAQITLRNFHVRYFAGNGVQLTTATMPLGAATCAGCVNQNNSYIARGMIYNTAGHGLVVAGLETNSIEINSVDVSVVKGACFLLASFLGSVYSTTHCAEAEFGAFYNPISPAPGS
ncbi:MAG TPA: hypothetical protein VEF04_01310, partial [Blastocatellia bacterium]|nr:hypothetical protein [Blastocatellia bacterium]